MVSRACFLVPTNRIVPPRPARSPANSCASVQQPLGLLQVDDVDPAALAEDEAAHLGVPAARLVAEVDAGLQQLLDADLGGQRDAPLCVGRDKTPAGRLADPGMSSPGRAATAYPGGVDDRVPAEDSHRAPEKKRGGCNAAPLPMLQLSVWPSGDWLPPGRVECATQLGGWFGLARASVPRVIGCLNISRAACRNWRVQAEPRAARARPRSGGPRRPDGRSPRGARGSDGCARSRGARAAAWCAAGARAPRSG